MTSPARDDPLEVRILNGVVFDFDRQALVGGVGGRPLRHGPGFQDAGPFEPEVPMQSGGRMFLNDEEMRAIFAPPAERLGG